MSVEDADTGDIYVDGQGKLWRIMGVCREPTVIAEEIESDPRIQNLQALQNQAAWQNMAANEHAAGPWVDKYGGQSVATAKPKLRKNGGIGGLMWKGWKRIYRP